MIIGAIFESFLGSHEEFNSMFFPGVFPGHFMQQLFIEILTARGPKTMFSYGKYRTNHSSTNVFFNDSRVDFLRFFDALGIVFLTFAVLVTEN